MKIKRTLKDMKVVLPAVLATLTVPSLFVLGMFEVTNHYVTNEPIGQFTCKVVDGYTPGLNTPSLARHLPWCTTFKAQL